MTGSSRQHDHRGGRLDEGPLDAIKKGIEKGVEKVKGAIKGFGEKLTDKLKDLTKQGKEADSLSDREPSKKPLLAYLVAMYFDVRDQSVTYPNVREAFRKGVRYLQDGGWMKRGSHDLTQQGRYLLNGMRMQDDWDDMQDEYGDLLDTVRQGPPRESYQTAHDGSLIRNTLTEGDDVGPQSTMIALYPPTHVADKMAHHSEFNPGKLHVTVLYLGKLTEGEAQSALGELQSVAKAMDPLDLRVEGSAVFSNDDALVRSLLVNGIGLARMHENLRDRMDRTGYVADPKHGFIPHLTLEYHDPDETLPRGWESISNEPWESWTCDSLYVVRSDEMIGEAPLSGVPNRVSDMNMKG